jgi:exodeoxyribonuclease V alpha subunit
MINKGFGIKRELEQEEKEVILSGHIRNFISPRAGNTKDGQWVSFGLILTKSKNKIHISKYGTVSCNGNCPVLKKNVIYKIKAIETFDEVYGYSYKINLIGLDISELAKEDQRKYLISAIGQIKTDLLYSNLSNPIKILEDKDIKTLCEIKGIKENSARELIKKYDGDVGYAEAISLLKKYDMTDNQIKALVDKIGSGTVIDNKIKKNPYFLLNAKGYGWEKTDKIAKADGIKPYDDRRIEAYVGFFLQTQADLGNIWMYQEQLWSGLCENLGGNLPDELVGKIIYNLEEKGDIFFTEDRERMALKRYYKMESETAKELVRLAKCENTFKYEGWEEKIIELEKQQGWDYTDEQINGIKAVLENQITTIIGSAGVGKTSIVSGMLKALEGQNYIISQCALAGRASANLSDTTGEEGYTIHRLLGIDLDNTSDSVFLHNKKNPLNSDIIIVDELSMIPIDIFYSLVQSIRDGAKLIMLGDIKQLETIGMGNVLNDIIQSKTIKVVELTKIHRQASDSGIISESLKASNKQTWIDKNFYGKKVVGKLKDMEYDIIADRKDMIGTIALHYKELIEKGINADDIIILTPKKEEGETSAWNLSNLSQDYLITNQQEKHLKGRSKSKYSELYYENDLVMNITNDYKKSKAIGNNKTGYIPDKESYEAVFNGDMGKVVYVDDNLQYMVVKFNNKDDFIYIPKQDLSSMRLAYSATTNKMQGSSKPYVICAIDYSHYMLLTKEMIYTMLTRAKKHCVMIAENSAYRYAISNSNISKKQTFLKEELQKYWFRYDKFKGEIKPTIKMKETI